LYQTTKKLHVRLHIVSYVIKLLIKIEFARICERNRE